jgi:hypothetical protein
MDEVILYAVAVRAVVTIEASSEDDAIAKAKEWVEASSGNLTYTPSAVDGYIKPKEG